MANLRKVEFCKEGRYGGAAGTPYHVSSEFETGKFHGFFPGGNQEEGLEAYALIELADGTMADVWPARIKFLDK